MALGGLLTAANLILSLVVGIRLLLRARQVWPLPELSLGVYFLMSAVIGTIPQLIVYSSLTDPSLAMPDATARVMLCIAVFTMAVGASSVYVFTWKVFRPDAWWAKGIAIAGGSTLAVGFVWEAVAEGFAPVVFAGPGHWLGWAARTVAMLGVTWESGRYYWMLRRRMRLGLADPVVTNQFLLWSLWAASSTVNYLADLVTRAVYVWLSGTTTELIPEILAQVVPVTLAVTNVLGAISAATLFLTFFPSERYRRWLESRASA